jgi:hypothetical protein
MCRKPFSTRKEYNRYKGSFRASGAGRCYAAWTDLVQNEIVVDMNLVNGREIAVYGDKSVAESQINNKNKEKYRARSGRGTKPNSEESQGLEKDGALPRQALQ